MSRALIVVDVQNDFCEGGSLAVAGGAEAAASITRLLADDHGYDYVVATRDHHIDPGSHFSDEPDFVDSWPPHCVVGTPGAEFHPNLGFRDFDAIFDKGEYEAAYSGFEGADHSANDIGMKDFLNSKDITEVDVVGIATDHCVRATALDAAAEKLRTTVLLELTAAVSPQRVPEVEVEWADHGVAVEGHLPTPRSAEAPQG